MNNKYNKISESTINRYNSRLDIHGKDIKTLGWGNAEQQEFRFTNILQATDFNKKNVLDIGCGFGDLYDFFKKSKIDIQSYTGWDLNVNLIKKANNIEDKIVKYEIVDITKSADSIKDKFDIGIMLGLLNYKLESDKLNYEYSSSIIKNAFNNVKEVLIVDFISAFISPNYPKEDFIFYHDPQIILSTALEITSNVVLKHNYNPIPQKEFMLYIYK
jgi:SAM-dependent methyltransferase